MNGTPKINWSEFARVVYPGLLVWVFIYWRYSEASFLIQDYAFSIPFSLIVGIFIYALYRGIVYYPVIRWIEDRTGGVPQFKFYRSVADQLNAPKKYKKMKWAAACANKVLVTQAPTEFSAGLYRFNSFVHVPFLTSFVVFLAFLHDLA